VLFAHDFSLAANIHTGINGVQDEDIEFNYKIDLWPSYSLLIGDNIDLLVSAGITFGMEDEEFYYIPELLQTHFTYRNGALGLRAGRMMYSDPLSYAANGLFDGLQLNLNSGAGRFNLGAWYTGFLYKKNANITMTEDEYLYFDEPVDYNDFGNTYFAPARMIAALGWEHPSVGEALHLGISAIGQFDFSDAEAPYNSQYIFIKAIVPKDSLVFKLGGSVGFFQTNVFDKEDNDNSIDVTGFSFAGEVGVSWLLPASFLSRLTLTGKYASGKEEDSYDAYNPITTQYMGNILNYRFSGLSVISLDYTARFAPSFGMAVNASYFIRNDLGTIKTYPVTLNNEGYFLGPEANIRFLWSPVSDVRLDFGGGVFFPSLGDAGSDEPIRFKAELKLIIGIL